jgi:hypothetical protein
MFPKIIEPGIRVFNIVRTMHTKFQLQILTDHEKRTEKIK